MLFDKSQKIFRNCVIIALVLFTHSCKRNTIQEETETKSAGNTANTAMRLVNNAVEPTTSACGVSSTNHFISLQYARQLVNNYQIASRTPGRVCQLFDQGGWVLSETFPAAVIQAILSQPGCCRFRIYNGIDTDKRLHLVIVGVNSMGRDVLRSTLTGPAASNTNEPLPDNPDDLNLIVEMGVPCPQACDGNYNGG